MQLLNIIKRYCSLLLTFALNSLVGQMEYRINFISGIIVESGFMLSKLAYVLLIYRTGVTINGMTPDHILIFIGVYAIMTGLYMMFYPNFGMISDYIKEGSMDFFLTKPVSPLFMVSFRYVDFAMPIPNILGGIIMVVVGWWRCGFSVTPVKILLFIAFIILGVVLTYAVFLLPRLLSFWTISTRGITQVSDALWDFNNMPMNVYNRVMQGVGCFLFPIFLITNVPGMVIDNNISGYFMLWACISPFIFLSITIAIWRIAIKRYASASS